MNPAAEAQLGLKREETIGRRAKEISPSAEQEWFTRYGEVVKTGISASFERHISTFNKYFNNQLIPLGNGLGLGVAIVKGIVELYGGRVEAFSEGIDKGTKFTIKLPLPKGNVSIQEFSERPDTKSNKSLKILIIDDNKDLEEMICELIGLLGYETECAHNGGDGIAKAGTWVNQFLWKFFRRY